MKQWLINLNQKIDGYRQGHKQRSLALRIIVLLLATIVLLAGILLIFLPGPGVVLIAIALGLYSLEFHWIARITKRLIKAEPSDTGQTEKQS